MPTEHLVVLGDGRKMDDVANESVHLVVTSPPTGTSSPMSRARGQLGLMGDYESFLAVSTRCGRSACGFSCPAGAWWW